MEATSLPTLRDLRLSCSNIPVKHRYLSGIGVHTRKYITSCTGNESGQIPASDQVFIRDKPEIIHVTRDGSQSELIYGCDIRRI